MLSATSSKRIRPLAICVFHRRGRILVNEAHDSLTGQRFHRPLGGAIEFGETSAEAIAREIREEIGAEATQLRPLGTLENIFTFGGVAGHEIVQVYDGEFVNQSLYERATITGVESNGQTFNAVWRALWSCPDQTPLYPNGLLPLLLQSLTHHIAAKP